MPKTQNPPSLPPLPPPRQRLRPSRPRATTTAGPFGDRMYEARTAAGLPLDEAAVHVRTLLSSTFGPSRETLRRYEDGTTTEDRADPLLVAAAAHLYGVDVDWLSPSVAHQLENVRVLLASPSTSSSSKQRTRRSPKAVANTKWSMRTTRPVTPRHQPPHPRVA